METAIQVGTVIAGTYQIAALIGRGGMGSVWSATHLRLPGKQVAIKFLNGSTPDAESFARFRREAEIASRLGHPNIVEVSDFNTLPDGTPYLVLELLRGESLARRLKLGALPVPEALLVARQVASALHAAHRQGVIHRDLKPDNIYLCPSEDTGAPFRVKVLDFGISKIQGSQTVQTLDKLLIGTPQYMSPEQASGRNSELDKRTDVFALGAIAYEMLSGAPAFSGASLAQVVYKVVYEEPQALEALAPSLPAQVLDAVKRAMAKDLTARFQDVGAFILALTGVPLQTLEPNSLAQVPQFARATDPTSAGAEAADDIGFEPTLDSSKKLEKPVTGPVHPGAVAPKRNVWVLAAIAALIPVGVAGFALYSLNRPREPDRASSKPGTEPSKPVAAVSREAPTSQPSAAVDKGFVGENVAPIDAGLAENETSPVDAGAGTVAVAVAVAENGNKEKSGTQWPTELAPDVEARLAEAKVALENSNPVEAVRLARQTLADQKTWQAYELLVRAYCHQSDLNNAKPLADFLLPAHRKQVVDECRQFDVDLE